MRKPRTTTRQRPGWTRIRGGCGGLWLFHRTGYRVRHCGHPTAIWPYHGETPDNAMVFAPNGRGFQLLAQAQAHIEHLAAQAGDLLQPPVPEIRSYNTKQADT